MSDEERPCRAAITSSDPANGTLAYLEVFGRRHTQHFGGKGHLDEGKRWVRAWEEHFAKVCGSITTKAAAADVLDMLVKHLQDEGVSALAITRAVAETRKEAGLA